MLCAAFTGAVTKRHVHFIKEAIMKGSSIKSVALVLAFGLLTACGGGGSGGGTVTGAYSGVTTQATVTTANATALSTDAYQNGGMGANANIAGVLVEGNGGAITSQPFLQEIGASLRYGVARVIQQQPTTGHSLVGVLAHNSINGAHSGSASYSIDVNQSTGAFTGSITFNSMKESANGPTISGAVTIWGNYNQSTGQFGSLGITFSPLSATTASGTSFLYGTISFSTTGTTETLNVSCTLNTGGQTYWVKDWTYRLTSGNTLTIAGRYYNPIYGYVDLATSTPLTVSSMSGDPTAGILLFTGSNGTKVKVTFTATGYTVEVDTSGNGQYVPLP